MAPASLSSVGHTAPAQGEGIEDMALTGAVCGADGEIRHPTSEESRERDQDLLQHLLIGVEVQRPAPLALRSEPSEAEEAGVAGDCGTEDVVTSSMAGDTLLVPDLAVSSATSPIIVPLVGSHAERRVVPLSVGRFHQVRCSLMFSCCCCRWCSVGLPRWLLGVGNLSQGLQC